jgi:putative tricarboxylic transport membrane protein
MLRRRSPQLFRVMMGIAACAYLMVSVTVSAQTAAKEASAYPSGQIRLVVPYSPGGGTDILARAMGHRLSDALHQPVIVDNRVGANGTIGAAFVAKAAPDGLTMILVPAGYAANPALYKSLPYDRTKDLAPVSLLASGPLTLVVHPSVPVKSVKELIALAKAKPNQLNVGSAGVGSLPHLSAELFKASAGVEMAHIPYKGAGPALVDLMGGRVQVYFMNILQSLPLIKNGQLRGLGVTSPQRSPIAPDLPPISDEIPGFDMTNWYGLLVPGGTPPEVVNALQREVAKVLNDPDVKEKLASEGMTVVASTPDAFAKFLAAETAKYNRIIEFAGIKNSL